MKKYTKVLALVLALTMLMGMSVFAADYEVTGSGIGEGDVKYDEELPKFDLTLDAESGEMYLLLVLAGDAVLPDKDNILYVNQETAEGDTVTFENVYPKSIANSTIYLAGGEDGLKAIGTVKLNGIKGDINLDTFADSTDLNILFNVVMGYAEEELSGTPEWAADMNEDTYVDSTDLNMLFNFVMGY